jgi:predicted nucleic acid-binding Zn finger protein
MEDSLLRRTQAYFEEKYQESSVCEINPEEVLSVYSFLTHCSPKLIEAALEVIDKQDNHRILKIVSQSTGRSFYLVQGSQIQKYLILSNYCPCPSFSQLFNKTSNMNFENITIDQKPPTPCKHLFAVSLATSLKRIDVQSVSDARFMELYQSGQ